MGASNFNLRQSVDNYISLIRNQGSITGSDAAELTAHLYDATDELKKSGLSEEEAFTIACKRLGNGNLLTEEYSKVNPSVRTNKIWAYLLIGYNMFYNIPKLIFLGVGGFYLLIHQSFGVSQTSVWVITLFHLLFIAGIYFLVRQKNLISRFIEKQVQVNPILIVCLSFIPFVFLFLAKPMFKIPVREWTMALELPMHGISIVQRPDFQGTLEKLQINTVELQGLNGTLVEFSFYLAVLSIVGGVLSLIFSIKFPGEVSLRSLFEKPSVLFLILFGVFIELMAASTRAIRFPFDMELIHSGNRSMWVVGSVNKIASAAAFGMVYLIASFLITNYNKVNGTSRYLLIFSIFGVIMEITVGIDADMHRVNTHYPNPYGTVYFVPALLIGIFLGKILGSKTSNESLIAQPN